MKNISKMTQANNFLQSFCIVVFLCASVHEIKGQTCPPGEYQNGVGGCDPCNLGKYCPGDGTEYSCSPGTYQDEIGKASCIDCPMGKYQAMAGQMACLDCDAGKYQNATGQTACLDCDAGKYQNATGQTSCIDCSAGKYQNATGQTSCLDCSAGKYQDATGATSCIDCSTGKYQNATGATSCIDCDAGTYQDAVGSTNCINCPTGTSSSVAGITNVSYCQNCATGTYQDGTGQTACKNCAVGTYQNQQGQVACIACPVGKYAANEGQTQCDNCPSGFTTAGTGATSDRECEVVLSVELMEFWAKIEQNIVRLSWITAQEINNSFYVLQKSQDTKTWTTIARINGKGTYLGKSIYNATDPFPAKGVTYYRLKQVDFDGTTDFSKVISIEYGQKSSIKVYPNPMTDVLNIAHGEEKVKSVAIYNVVGQLVRSYTFDITHIGTINLTDLWQGQYILRITTEGSTYVERINKMR
jgi:hypothetical protein